MPPPADTAGDRRETSTRSPRRIALIASSFAPHVGGVETHVEQIAALLRDRGHVVEVWAADRGMRTSRPLPVPVRYLRTPLPARTADGVYRMLWLVPRAWRAWRRAHIAFRPDVLAVQCFGPNGVYAAALHRAFGTPLVVSSHGETLGDDNSAFRSALLRRSLRSAIAQAAEVTAPSAYVLDDLRRRFGLAAGDGRIVSNGVRLDIGVHSPDSPRQPLVLAVGRLGRMKGFDLLIGAFREAAVSGSRLEIIGDGAERHALQEQIERDGLDGRVRLAGRLSAEEVAARMSEAAVVVVPSRSESFGLVALEAWRSGTALIMTSRGAAHEFIHDGDDALVVDPEDLDALAAALRSLLGDESRRLQIARRGALRFAEFSWDAVADAYESVFQRATAEQT